MDQTSVNNFDARCETTREMPRGERMSAVSRMGMCCGNVALFKAGEAGLCRPAA